MNNAQGIDISHWSGDINWGITKDYVDFVIVKATEGTSFVDHKFYENKAGLESYGIPWGAYHYFRPEYYGTTQATHFVNTVGTGCNVYVCDVEKAYGMSGYAIISRVKAFLDTVESLTGKKGVIYTSPGFWNPLPSPDWATDYDLWVAAWYRNEPLLPADWDTWKIWQYSAIGSIPGIPSATDLNEFNGDVYAVEEYFGNGEVVEPPPVSYPLVSITAYKLNVRDAPWGNIVGTFPRYTVVGVTGQVLDGSGRLWYRSGSSYFASWHTVPV